MLQKIGTVAQVKTIKEKLHPDLYQAVVHDLHLLDSAENGVNIHGQINIK